LKEIKGNFWSVAHEYELILITTNGIVKQDGTLVMGAGMAKQAADRFTFLPKLFGFGVKRSGNIPLFVNLKEYNFLIGSFPTKNHFKDDSDINLIKQSAANILSQVNTRGINKILTTRPGCGLGRLNWTDVKTVLKDVGWDDRFTIIS